MARKRVTAPEHRWILGRADLRPLESRRFREDHEPTEDMATFLRCVVLPQVEFTGYKVQQQRETAVVCLSQLVAHGVQERVIADTRNTGTSGVRARVRVWDSLIRAGFVRYQLGSEQAEKVTRYYPSRRLFRLRDLWELGFFMDPTDNPLGLVSVKDNPRSIADLVTERAQGGDPRAIQNGLAYFRALEDQIEAINRENLRHSWRAWTRDVSVDGAVRVTSYQPNVCIRQVHSRELWRCARLYTWGPVSAQGLSKLARASMEVDGERVVELDFSCNHVRMLYHSRGLDPKGDLYRPHEVFPHMDESDHDEARAFVKKATNIALNTDDPLSAAQALQKELNESSAALRRLVGEVEGIGARGVLERVERAHPDLEDLLFTGEAENLMTVEGKIMLAILSDITATQRPALGIHDSVVVRARDADFARHVMREVYANFMRGFEPEIR